MPELPEVETVVREIRPVITGARFWKITAVGGSRKDPFHTSFAEAADLLKGKTVNNIGRRGKYIIIELSGDLVMVVHLRMTGMLLFEPSLRLKKFLRVKFVFTNGQQMFFSDIRRFGRIWVADKRDYLKVTGLDRLGLDPVQDGLAIADLESTLYRRTGILKNKLLDQRLIAGIGNIYADEICFRVGLHPASRLEKLRKQDLRNLRIAILECLQEGIEHNGTTISDFVGTRGDAGKHQKYLRIYGRVGDKCYVCGETVLKTKVAGRGTHFCPRCQTLRK